MPHGPDHSANGIHAHAPIDWKLNVMIPLEPPHLIPGPSFVTQHTTVSYHPPHHVISTSTGLPHINVMPHGAFATSGSGHVISHGSSGFSMNGGMHADLMTHGDFIPHGGFMPHGIIMPHGDFMPHDGFMSHSDVASHGSLMSQRGGFMSDGHEGP